MISSNYTHRLIIFLCVFLLRPSSVLSQDVFRFDLEGDATWRGIRAKGERLGEQGTYAVNQSKKTLTIKTTSYKHFGVSGLVMLPDDFHEGNINYAYNWEYSFLTTIPKKDFKSLRVGYITGNIKNGQYELHNGKTFEITEDVLNALSISIETKIQVKIICYYGRAALYVNDSFLYSQSLEVLENVKKPYLNFQIEYSGRQKLIISNQILRSRTPQIQDITKEERLKIVKNALANHSDPIEYNKALEDLKMLGTFSDPFSIEPDGDPIAMTWHDFLAYYPYHSYYFPKAFLSQNEIEYGAPVFRYQQLYHLGKQGNEEARLLPKLMTEYVIKSQKRNRLIPNHLRSEIQIKRPTDELFDENITRILKFLNIENPHKVAVELVNVWPYKGTLENGYREVRSIYEKFDLPYSYPKHEAARDKLDKFLRLSENKTTYPDLYSDAEKLDILMSFIEADTSALRLYVDRRLLFEEKNKSHYINFGEDVFPTILWVVGEKQKALDLFENQENTFAKYTLGIAFSKGIANFPLNRHKSLSYFLSSCEDGFGKACLETAEFIKYDYAIAKYLLGIKLRPVASDAEILGFFESTVTDYEVSNLEKDEIYDKAVQLVNDIKYGKDEIEYYSYTVSDVDTSSPQAEYETRGRTRTITKSRVVNRKRRIPLIAEYRHNDELYDFAIRKISEYFK